MTHTVGRRYIRWQNQTLLYSDDSGASWKLFSTHPLSQRDYPIATTFGQPSRGYRTAQILLAQGYKYASLFVWQSGRQVYAASVEEAASQVRPNDTLVETQASHSAYAGLTAEQLLTLASVGDL